MAQRKNQESIVSFDKLADGGGSQFLPNHRVRAVVAANVADLTAFTVAGNDGVTLVEGDRVLLVNQTTAAQCGLYVVGPVSAGTAKLQRAADMKANAPMPTGRIFEVGEGTLYGGSTWKVTATDGGVIGTNDPLLYPKAVKGTATLVAGAVTLGATQGLWLLSGASVQVSRNTANTTASTVAYSAPAASRTTGKVGTAAVLLRAEVAAGTLNNADISTVDYTITNW